MGGQRLVAEVSFPVRKRERTHIQFEQRLKDLNSENASGSQMLAELEIKQYILRDTLLWISGAIQVIEEELAKAQPAETGAAAVQNGVSQPIIKAVRLTSNEMAANNKTWHWMKYTA